ncbi:MAG: anaerobic ribonucleoside-triphosphate reductase activating protein [Actinobacteria bacterium HGW-Actinobacteria-6]|nr:MAG: anaerobic ribonucleoside-triphosphate reductase activating protein [Actinobacteria bacterium HGW-Actinobacteria-6]
MAWRGPPGCRAPHASRKLKGTCVSVRQTGDMKLTAPTRRLVGWLPSGMLDWPGRLSSTVFLGGCDFRCPFCHNEALVSVPDVPAEWSSLITHLEAKRNWLDGVVITGGEPTVDPGLPEMLRTFTEMGIPVKLDTNGNHPDVLKPLLAEGLISYVALDLKTPFSRYASLTGVAESSARVAESVEIIIDSGIAHEFRTTVYPGAVTLEDLEEMARTIEGGDRYALQQFVPTTTLDPRASAVLPYHPDALHESAARCSRFLPTIVRGA